MIYKFKEIILISLILTPMFIFSETEICSKLKGEKKQADCYKKEFEKQDKILNQVYRGLLKTIDKSLAEKMKLDSRAWIDKKESYCNDSNYVLGSGEEIKKSSYYSCLKDFTDSRILFLKRGFGREKVKPGLVGEYDDGDGGTLIIAKKKKDQYSFSFTVVRGPTSHGGEINGTLKGIQKEKRWKEDKEGETCELNFIFSDYTIEVKEIECMAFHGVRAYFDGIYRKVK